MKFTKGQTIAWGDAVYPSGSFTVDGYEADGTLLAYPIGGGLEYRFKPGAEQKFRAVSPEEKATSLWRRSRFTIEEIERQFWGWTDGSKWNGWAMPYFEFEQATRVLDCLTEGKGRYDSERDCFAMVNSDGEEEIWEARRITVLCGRKIKVYGVGAGAWIWDEVLNKRGN